MWQGSRDRLRGRWIGSKLWCSSQTQITDGYKLQQPVRIKYGMDNWWALDIKSVLGAYTACVWVRVHVVFLCRHVCVCVCNWWGLDRDTGRPPKEVRDTLPGSCRLWKKYMHRSCQASYPLHLYLQNHDLRITPSLRNKLDGHVCTATRMQTHCCMNIAFPNVLSPLMRSWLW